MVFSTMSMSMSMSVSAAASESSLRAFNLFNCSFRFFSFSSVFRLFFDFFMAGEFGSVYLLVAKK